ncbi:uncharacterized protein LOC115684598 isoform X2 [Syzygium oleosum]|uniref:uncharacterized protein LOC115684598 isoform X2 n=1 Tax=Syzygium oleosum TaxID=219896 RepID=UPI0024B88A0D|nr:uncharacterized protein LOC115684598 isoform X2 [Syzygium oleosum]
MELLKNEALELSRPGLLVGESFNLVLKRAMEDLLADIRRETPNTASFVDAFYQLMQSRADPHLESIWVYAALTSRGRSCAGDDVLDRVAAAKDSFLLIKACSSSCSHLKSVSLLAPVMFEVYGIVSELFARDLSSKRDRRAVREVQSLVDAVVGYLSICSCEGSYEGGGSETSTGIADLVCVWLGQGENSERFFPLLTDDISRALIQGGCGVHYLAGAVIAEAFLLKMCLKLRVKGATRSELEKELRSWAVASITGFRNSYFFEILVRMLIQSTLPGASFLGSEDQALLRKVLYDATILVEYSFLGHERVADLPTEHVKNLLMTRLIVAYKAIEFFREHGDQTLAISYINAFSSSALPSQIMKLARRAIGVEIKASGSAGSSPRALIKWLLELEDRGLRFFDDSLLKCRAKLVFDVSVANEKPVLELEDRKQEDDVLFYIDNKGEEKDVDGDGDGDGDGEGKDIDESMSAAFIAAAHVMEMTENEGKKRKQRKRAGKEKRIKFLKYELAENADLPGERSKGVGGDGAGSASEVDNPSSDDDE